jgi:adenine-specific DNA methylase
MSQEQESHQARDRPELPIENGFPIERINEIAEKESRAKQYYRPIYTMHKWWARRPGCLFRAITLYSLLDENTTADDIEVYEPGENEQLGTNGLEKDDLVEAIRNVSMDSPESLWDFYSKDVRIKNRKILDPFMGGGTSLVEASRFGVDTTGVDLNPVAWFVTKKQLDAGQTNVEKLEDAFQRVKNDVAEDILQYYRTPCPDGNHEADVMYNFWVKELDCISCGQTVPLFKDYRVAAGRYENDDKYNVFCPECNEVVLVDSWQDESDCGECGHTWTPKDGNVKRGGSYNCPHCGQKYPISDAAAEQGGYEYRLYGVEYYCPSCDDEGRKKSDVKGYKSAEPADIELFNEAKHEWEESPALNEFVPDHPIPAGWKTASSDFDGSAPGAGDIKPHGIHDWTDMYNERQLLCLSKLLRSITEIGNQESREYLLLAFTEALNFNTMMVPYQAARNHTNHLFKSNSFDPPQKSSEGNLWGTEYGIGRFRSTFDMITRAIEYAHNPTDRYIQDGDTVETPPFAHPIGNDASVYQGDMRTINASQEYDAVITDPPYYDNVLYAELSGYYYVWLRLALEDDYACFEPTETPREESIVTNPALGKSAEDFETDLRESFEVINEALVSDGVLTFTYHHSDSESWGELLTSLCDSGFEVTATYPINSDMRKFIKGESVSFDIVLVARPTDERTPISWRRLRIDILNGLETLREGLKDRELTQGDIGVVAMGACFAEYSKHHNEVRRDGEIMTAKEAVSEIYDIIAEGALGEDDIFLDLLRSQDPSYDDLSKLLRRSDVSEEELREKALFRMDSNDFRLGNWSDEKRQAYIIEKVESGDGELTPLEQAHFLRYRYEDDKSTREYRAKWEDDDLRELCEGLAEASGDDTYLKMLGVDVDLSEFQSS